MEFFHRSGDNSYLECISKSSKIEIENALQKHMFQLKKDYFLERAKANLKQLKALKDQNIKYSDFESDVDIFFNTK